ncbi:MAG: hypothetical protein J07HQW2_03432 [Haloquadratum walsbyi J07HQW2]|uniref:Uncharacterized protein n=1 Tax=Haloquadratum walsbyi J07HQW2 TaxID=1238425 RepID=U1NJ51_9EURY|nr:MAG: hypothetical protein J07HQW2_03432 [Haloquadratum walsbyi J07HQW2]
MADPTPAQRRLLVGLFMFAIFIFIGGLLVIAYLAGSL